MSDQYIGEIRPVGFNYAPAGWAFCDGSLLQISQYDALFALIGTTYGGDGQNTFGLPDLRGRVPVHQGTGGGSVISMGTALGSESVTLTSQQLGGHGHPLNTGPSGNVATPGASTVLADVGGDSNAPSAYGPAGSLTAMGTGIGPAGGSQGHENRQPFLAINFIIATQGIYPTQS